MSESNRMTSLFEKLYDGHPWIDVAMVTTLQGISAGQAAHRPLTNCNSIWEITNHLISWRMNVLQRVQGQVMKTPGNNYIEPVKDDSEKAWADTLEKLAATQRQWLQFLKTLQTEQLEKVYPPNEMNYYEHIQGIIQHDAYHLGQIVLLAKIFPPVH